MCYSAQIASDFRTYQRLGGDLDLDAYIQMAGWSKKHGTWTQRVPKGLRNAFLDSTDPAEQDAKAAALDAYQAAALALEEELAAQGARLAKAKAVLAGPKPTKKAENDQRVAAKKIAAARAKLVEVHDHAVGDGYDRIWPGGITPVLMRDPATGERRVVPMRYRCRLPSWTEVDEKKWDGTYNARRDKLSTAWRELWGATHGVMVARRIYESVALHRLDRRALVPGEREVPVEIEFRPEPEQDLLLACLWRYVEPEGDEPGFYTVAAITGAPLPDFAAAGHDRSVIAIKPEHLDAWLNPQASSLGEMVAILDDPAAVTYAYAPAERGLPNVDEHE